MINTASGAAGQEAEGLRHSEAPRQEAEPEEAIGKRGQATGIV